MDKRKSAIGLIVIACITAACWAFGLFGGIDPALADLQQMRDQIFDQQMPDVQRDQLRAQFRERIQTLSDEQRRAFFDTNRDQWRGRMGQRMNEFFAMSPVDQRKRLDEMIDRMRQPREPRAQNGSRGERGGSGDRGNWASMTESQRDARAKRRLDRSSATERAQMTEFRRRLDQRAKQRGISDLGSRGPYRGRYGA